MAVATNRHAFSKLSEFLWHGLRNFSRSRMDFAVDYACCNKIQNSAQNGGKCGPHILGNIGSIYKRHAENTGGGPTPRWYEIQIA